MNVGDKKRTTILRLTTVACGLLGLVLLRWTPTTGKGILIYAGLFALLIAMAIVLSPRKNAGYWPNKPEDWTNPGDRRDVS